jgi:hypothetical protein
LGHTTHKDLGPTEAERIAAVDLLPVSVGVLDGRSDAAIEPDERG